MMEYYHFFVDAWRFFKRYFQSAENKNEWWDEMISKANEVVEEYKNRPFAKDMMAAVINELDRVAHKRKGR